MLNEWIKKGAQDAPGLNARLRPLPRHKFDPIPQKDFLPGVWRGSGRFQAALCLLNHRRCAPDGHSGAKAETAKRATTTA